MTAPSSDTMLSSLKVGSCSKQQPAAAAAAAAALVMAAAVHSPNSTLLQLR
jgi:hypothetical protein